MSPASPSPSAGARRLYFDTSAYLCVLLAEEGHGPLVAEAGGAELKSSVLLMLEARRNLIRLAREGTLTPDQYNACVHRVDQDQQLFDLRDFTLDLCAAHPLPAVSTPRSLDLVHLRTALWFHGQAGLTRFVTMDAAQAEAAKELGLPT